MGSVIVLSFFWHKSKLEQKPLHYELSSRFIEISSKIISVILRLASLAIFFTVLFAALFGELGSTATIAPVAIYIIFWVGLVFLSAFLGDMWRVLSPWDSLSAAGSWIKTFWKKFRMKQIKPENTNTLNNPQHQHKTQAILAPSPEISTWLATISLLAFVWLELVHPDPADTRLVGILILLYTAYLLAGAGMWGRSWLHQADTFAILHRFIGSLGIFSKDSRKKSKSALIRPPLIGTAQLHLSNAQTAFLLVLLGSTTFDGVTNTDWWEGLLDTGGWEAVPLDSLGLVGVLLGIGGAYYLAMYIASRMVGKKPLELARAFAHSLVPIALAYLVAHYFSLLIFEGQDFVPLLSDPLQQGWNLFGTRHIGINYRLISTDTIAWVQALSILIGHLWGVFLAHDRALNIFPDKPGLANKSQYPLVIIMLGYTVLGLYLLLNA